MPARSHPNSGSPEIQGCGHKTMSKAITAKDYPYLAQARRGDSQRWQFELRAAPPPAELISNVYAVSFVGARCLLIRMMHRQRQVWDLTGGTLEPGETYLDAIRRELMEEAGAQLLTFEPFGAWHCWSSAPAPYRPHLPHPESYRVVGYGEAALVGSPTNPPDGEQVIEVACVSVEEAVQRLRTSWPDRPELAELYQLAAALRATRHDGSVSAGTHTRHSAGSKGG